MLAGSVKHSSILLGELFDARPIFFCSKDREILQISHRNPLTERIYLHGYFYGNFSP
jgi:hypothetical protein